MSVQAGFFYGGDVELTMASKQKSILVVDNDPFFLKLFTEFLEQEGYPAVCFPDSFQALEWLNDNTPGIVFLDLIMPFLGGDDLCRIIRDKKRFAQTFIVIVSAVALERPVDISSLGADACIAKGPFAQMRKSIREIIREVATRPASYPLKKTFWHDGIYPREISSELLQQHDHLKVMLDKMSQGIIEIAQGRLTYLNQSAEEMLAITKKRVIGSDIHTILPIPLLDVIAHNREDPVTSATRQEKRQIQFNERQFIAEMFHLSQEHRDIMLILTDITERKRMESIIEAANLTENLGYVFSGIRHEIGNPVNSIKMALSVLQRNLHEYSLETITEFLDRSLVEISRIEYLLKALKSYSLFETPVVQDICIADFLRDFITLIRNDFETLNIQISTVVADENLFVKADSRALHHVMLNILTNAADALETTEKPRIAISCYRKGEMVVIKVDDNGKGVAEDAKEHLFKPFFTSKSTGTGLGLAIVRKMLNAMQGFIGIESYQGIGTTVSIALPGVENAR